MNMYKKALHMMSVSVVGRATAKPVPRRTTVRSMNDWQTRSVGVVVSILLLASTAGCGGGPAVVTEDVRDMAHAWRINRNPQLERMWGINITTVRLVSSDWMLQFKYRVTDPEKARSLLDHQAKPYLTDKPSGAMLAVPAMENVGELRQVSSLVTGRDYFIIFGNANKVVRRGNRVNVQIGAFHADDLVVE